MNKYLLSVLKYIFLLAIAIGLLYLAFQGVDIGRTIHAISQANYFWLSASVLVSLVAFVSRAYRWNLLIEPLGYNPKSTNTMYSLMVGYLANLAVPRLGEVSRCGSLSKAEKIPFNGLLGTVIVERVIDVICLLICLLLTAFVEYDRVGNFLEDSIINPITLKVNQSLQSVMFISVAAIILVALTGTIFWFVKKSRQSGAESKIMVMIKGLFDGLLSIGQLKRPWAFIFHTLLIWFMYFLMAYLAFFAMPVTSSLTWSAGLFILVVGGLGMSAPVQGGIGAYHLLVSQGLTLYGLSREDGLAFATMLHTSQMLIVIVLGSVSFLLLFFVNKNSANDVAGENK
ncbi:MAG: lysylphosphatidylglycerol synthase transmembrane domain-containing protein [Bacteroidetes bacterium]|nr:lysylphosphatidylglycerol synthase transmembrane domain-containing protein [Bacteroidota bacterium]